MVIAAVFEECFNVRILMLIVAGLLVSSAMQFILPIYYSEYWYVMLLWVFAYVIHLDPRGIWIFAGTLL